MTQEEIKKLLSEMMDKIIKNRTVLEPFNPEEIEKNNPNGVVVLRDELTGWFDSVDKEPSARAFFLEGFDGNKPYQFDRIMRGSGYIENHCLSLLGGIQPDKLVTYLEPSIKGMGNDGLFQRFQLLVYPDATEWQYTDDKPNTYLREQVLNIFKQPMASFTSKV